MRKILGLVCLFVMMVGTSMAEEIVAPPPQPVNCDGRGFTSGKCEGGAVPAGYYESQGCQGDLPGLGNCLNAVAFNFANFACWSPKAGPSTPPAYDVYCLDSTETAECMIKRACVGKDKTGNNGTMYTTCSISGTPLVTTRYLKQNLTTNSNPSCILTLVSP